MPQYHNRRNYTNKVLDKKIRNIENNLMELKYKDYYDASGATLSATGIVFDQFCFINSGDSAIDRDGNVVNPTSLRCSAVITADAPEAFRVVVFWDGQTNGAGPILQGNPDALIDNSAVLATTFAPRNFNTIDRYTILYDKVFVINQMGYQGGDQVHVWQKTFKVGRKIKYDAATTSTGITNLVGNVLCVAFFGNGALLSDCAFRLYFRDS